MKPGTDFVGVGVGILILDQGKVLLLKRKGSHGEGTWCLPGGHLEFNESFEECAKREAKEEVNVDIHPEEVMSISNNKIYDKHYVTIGVRARIIDGIPRIMEPEKCDELKWFYLDALPENLFQPTERVIAHHRGEPLG